MNEYAKSIEGEDFVAIVRDKQVTLPRAVARLTIKQFVDAFEISVRARNGISLIMSEEFGRNIDAMKMPFVEFSMFSRERLMKTQNMGKISVNEISEAMSELANIYNYPEELRMKLVSNFKDRELMRGNVDYAIEMLRAKDYIVIPPKQMIRFLRENSSWRINSNV